MKLIFVVAILFAQYMVVKNGLEYERLEQKRAETAQINEER